MAKRTTKSTSATRKSATRTTKTRKTTSKPIVSDATSEPVVAQVAEAAEMPLPKVVKMIEPVLTAEELKKKELIDLVVARSGIKKKDVKPSVEAMLEILGEMIAEGRDFNLQPFGKLRLNRTEDKGNGRVYVCRIRQSAAVQKDTSEPLAEPAE